MVNRIATPTADSFHYGYLIVPLSFDGASEFSAPFSLPGRMNYIEFSPFAAGTATLATLQRLSGDGATWIDTATSATLSTLIPVDIDSVEMSKYAAVTGVSLNFRIKQNAAEAGTMYVYSRD